MELEDVKARWKEYIEELFYDDRPDMPSYDNINDEGPCILQQEVRVAIESMKKGKAVGGDGIALEMLVSMGEFGIRELTKL